MVDLASVTELQVWLLLAAVMAIVTLSRLASA
jgi:hypothetical protein